VAKSVFRCVLIGAVLILLFGVGTNAFSATLADAYGILIGNGWTAKDALGFLGTSIAGTIAMNPSLAPTVAAGALSAYIVVKGSQLYDIYQEWRTLGMGVAMLNPVEYSQSMSVKRLANGEYGWGLVKVEVSYGKYSCGLNIRYEEYVNDNGRVNVSWGYGMSGSAPQSWVIDQLNNWLRYYVPAWHDQEGKTMFTGMVQAAYTNLVSNNSYSGSYSRQVVAGLEIGSNSLDSTLGYRVNVNPASISEEGVQYLGDPDAFYQWFLTNYMNGTNEGTFVIPTNESYNEIRSDLQTIINQLNNLSSVGGVSEETLNQLKTDILNALDTKFGDLDSTLSSISDSIDSKLNTLESEISAVQTSIDTLSGEINETLQEGLEQERGLWDRLMEWLDETLFVKLRELLETLFLPTEEELEELFDIELPEYQKNFAADVSFSSESVSMPISLFGASVDLSGYITQYASGLRTFINMFVSGLAAFFVIRAFRVHISID